VPLTAADQAAGYWWELSMRQVETSRTMVFDAPRQARAFFEALIADNLDLGRPEHVEILFKRDPRGRKPKDQAGGTFRTAIDRNSQGVTKSTTASCARSWPATSPRPRPRSATHCASSTTKSPGASPQHDSRQPPDQPDARLIPRYPTEKLKTNVKVLRSKLR